jgi:hypothetical protein
MFSHVCVVVGVLHTYVCGLACATVFPGHLIYSKCLTDAVRLQSAESLVRSAASTPANTLFLSCGPAATDRAHLVQSCYAYEHRIQHPIFRLESWRASV